MSNPTHPGHIVDTCIGTDRVTGKFYVEVKIDRGAATSYLGPFDTEDEARRASDNLAELLLSDGEELPKDGRGH